MTKTCKNMIMTCNIRLTGMIITFAAMFAIVASSHAQDLSGIKCVVNGDANASPDATVDYRDAKVHVCCPKCVKAFMANPDAFATRANHQLVLTGQYQQAKCPITGGEVDPKVTSNVAGTSVAFCCPNCVKKVDAAEEMADRAKLVFGNEAFEKSFVKAEVPAAVEVVIDLAKARCPMRSKQKVSDQHSVSYLEGEVFFCCPKCVKAFEDAPEEYAVAANQQLVATGQYVQVGCPLVGGPISSDHAVDVEGISVGLCCEKCVAVFEKAKSAKEKADLLFGPERFAEAFKPASTQAKRTEANPQPVEDSADAPE